MPPRACAPLLLLLVVVTHHAAAAPTLSCHPGVINDRFQCSIEGLNLNELLPSGLEDAIVAKARSPTELTELLPPDWSRGILDLAGINSRYCKNFCFPAGQECVPTPLGEVCTPQACADLCVSIPGYNTINIAPATIIDSALDGIADGLEDLTRKVFDAVELLPDFSVHLFVTADCDPALGLEILAGDDVVLNTMIPVSELQGTDSGDVGLHFGDNFQYDPSSRTMTVTLPVPLTVGMVTVDLELRGVIIGTRGASIATASVRVGSPSENTLVFSRDDALVIGTVDACYGASSCAECAAESNCAWCSKTSTCSPVEDDCPCNGCTARAVTPEACVVPREMCWASPGASLSSSLTVSEYAEELGRLEVLSPSEASSIAVAIDTNGDNQLTAAEVSAYEAAPELHPQLTRPSNDSIDTLGVFAILFGVAFLVASALVVVVGIKRPHMLVVRRSCRRKRQPHYASRRHSAAAKGTVGDRIAQFQAP